MRQLEELQTINEAQEHKIEQLTKKNMLLLSVVKKEKQEKEEFQENKTSVVCVIFDEDQKTCFNFEKTR